MDYSSVAGSYASHRWALPWKLDPLLRITARLHDGARIAEVGCGTGDYLLALHDHFPSRDYSGFDLSPAMLAQARDRCPWALRLEAANAESSIPAGTGDLDFAYAVDVLHHLRSYEHFFHEMVRVLRSGGELAILTDSVEDIHARSLGKLFPATVPINLERYPDIRDLELEARKAGLQVSSRRTVYGFIPLDARFMESLASKALSELRLISAEDHRKGMERAEASKATGDQWLSQSTALTWIRE